MSSKSNELQDILKKGVEDLVRTYDIDTAALFTEDDRNALRRRGMSNFEIDVMRPISVQFPVQRPVHPYLDGVVVSRGGMTFYSNVQNPEFTFDRTGTIGTAPDAVISHFTFNRNHIDYSVKLVHQNIGVNIPYLKSDKSTHATLTVWMEPGVGYVGEDYPLFNIQRYRHVRDADVPFAISGDALYGPDGSLRDAGIGIKLRGDLTDWEDDEKIIYFNLAKSGSGLSVKDAVVGIVGLDKWTPIPTKVAKKIELSYPDNLPLRGDNYLFDFNVFGVDLYRAIPRKIDPVLEAKSLLDRITNSA